LKIYKFGKCPKFFANFENVPKEIWKFATNI
jgi:hypothetical protein